ncbi:hypothetical protein LCGC14_1069420 [marine sediment metagenome]|uniref:Uncharacterized protein n=1 Tax=marine sediment metagenome TaxID=412755 RepID=A0A0F9MIS5_9ZZZZ
MGTLALVGCEKSLYSTLSRPPVIRSGQKQPWPQHYMRLVEKDGVRCMVYDFGDAGGISCDWEKAQ